MNLVSLDQVLSKNTLGSNPSWINTNWFLPHALRKHGYLELADAIVAKSHECIERSGFREYYHPYTAEGLGAKDFGWSTLILDM